MVNPLRIKIIPAVIAAALLVAVIAGIVVAKTKTIKYLPQDYSMEMIKQDFKTNPIVLLGVDCSSAPEAQEYFTCQSCTTLRQLLCKDCCFLGAPADGQLRCTDGDPAYCDTKPGLPFDTADFACPQAQCTETACDNQQPPNMTCPPGTQDTHYQEKGCPPTTKPDDSGPNRECRGDEAEWYCNRENLHARSACSVRAEFKDVLNNCGSMQHYEEREQIWRVHTPPPKGPLLYPASTGCDNDWEECWRYPVTQAFQDCVQNCKTTAAVREDCSARQRCCLDGICPAEEPSGIVNCPHRIDPNDPMQACDKRIAKQCDTTYAIGPCNEIIQHYNDWLLSPDAPECFKPIDPGQKFQYRFVARSNEKITITWQVLCNAVKKGNPDETDRMFYTMVKVRDESGEQKPFGSVIHQRSFQNKFFISAATTVAAGYLQAGKAYIVEIYYYIPQLPNEELQMNVEYLQLIMHRNRE